MTWREEKIRFGRFRGKTLGDVTIPYLAWLIDNFEPRPVAWEQRFAQMLNIAAKELEDELDDARMEQAEEDYEWIDPLDFGNR